MKAKQTRRHNKHYLVFVRTAGCGNHGTELRKVARVRSPNQRSAEAKVKREIKGFEFVMAQFIAARTW